MNAAASRLLQRKVMLETVNFHAKAIVQKASVCTDKGSVDNVDGFLDQTKRVSK